MGSVHTQCVNGGRANYLDRGVGVRVSDDLRRLSDSLCSYGTPYLLKLGLKEQWTSLVWLAGPISGLVAQPVIGRSFFPTPDLLN